jgi:murein DD-endopeptidase MepM/ murein hydrolase activator NlpD
MDPSITWPLASNVIRGGATNNTFGMVRKNKDGSARPHQGWDFKAAVGEPGYAIADGKIVMVKDHGDYGKQLALEFSFKGTIYYAFYAHLKQIHAQEGDSVQRNALIAACGKSGNASNLPASEDHLHFEIRTKKQPGLGLKDRVSPMVVFGHLPLTQPVPG